MPKIVDYASRYEFLRQAAFSLVGEEGVAALTRRAVAARLGCGLATVCRLVDPSTELATLAADEVLTRRRAGRWGRLPEDPDEAARTLMHRLIPGEPSRIAEELVWLRLVAAHARVPRGRESVLGLRHDFQVAERGWSDVDLAQKAPHEDPVDPAVETAAEIDSVSGGMARYFADHEGHVSTVIGRVLGLLEVADEDQELESYRLRALVDGLTSAACLGRIRPDHCVQTMNRHLADLRRTPG